VDRGKYPLPSGVDLKLSPRRTWSTKVGSIRFFPTAAATAAITVASGERKFESTSIG
jgi:hypothetical protein